MVDNGYSLENLVYSSNSYSEEHNQSFDNVFLAKMIQLRQIGILRKEDIQEDVLFHILWAKKNIKVEIIFDFWLNGIQHH